MGMKYPALAEAKGKSAGPFPESTPRAARPPGALMALGNLVVGFFGLMMMAFVLTVLSFDGVFLLRDGSVAKFVAGSALLVWTIFVQLPSALVLVFMTGQCGSVDGPVMLRLAERQRGWPQGLRQVIGVWWIMHAVPTVALLASMATAPPDTDLGIRLALGAAVALFAALSFGFLAMAWACFDKSDVRLRGLWNLRWWWVAAIAFACLLVSLARRFGLL